MYCGVPNVKSKPSKFNGFDEIILYAFLRLPALEIL